MKFILFYHYICCFADKALSQDSSVSQRVSQSPPSPLPHPTNDSTSLYMDMSAKPPPQVYERSDSIKSKWINSLCNVQIAKACQSIPCSLIADTPADLDLRCSHMAKCTFLLWCWLNFAPPWFDRNRPKF